MQRDDRERAAADAAGRAQDGDAARRTHAIAPEPNKPSAYSGAAAVTLSMRSRTPPCPGSSAPLSLSPAERLNMLSVRSPTTEKTPTTQPKPTHGSDGQPEIQRPAPGDQGDRQQAARRPFPGLAGAHPRREFVPAQTASGKECADVRRDHHQQQPQHDLRSRNPPVTGSLQPRERDECGDQHRHAAQQRERAEWRSRGERQPEQRGRPPDTGNAPAGSADAPGRSSSASSARTAAPSRRRTPGAPARSPGRRSRPIPRHRAVHHHAEHEHGAPRRQHEQAQRQQAAQDHSGRNAHLKHRLWPRAVRRSCRSAARARRRTASAASKCAGVNSGHSTSVKYSSV